MDGIPTREELALYCRADDDEGTLILLETLALDAAEYLRGAGIEHTQDNDRRYQLAVKALVLHWWDNPTGGAQPQALDRLVNQLRFERSES